MKTQTGSLHASVGFSSGGGIIVRNSKVVGYQIQDWSNALPFEFHSNEVLTESSIEEWLDSFDKTRTFWRKVPIHEGEISNPVFLT